MNKTCGECKHYKPYNEKICLYVHRTCVPPKTKACSSFAKSTNGDVIRQGGNRSLAEFQQLNTCDNCIYNNDSRLHDYCDKPVDKTCTDGILAWLNAPANCVAKNGESAKQADLCYKSAKESEEGEVLMAQSESAKRRKKMLRMAENLDKLTANLGRLMALEEITAVEAEKFAVHLEKDATGIDRAVLRMKDVMFWASMRRGQDKVVRQLSEE